MLGSTDMTDNYLWKPSAAVVEYSNIGRFMRRHRIGSYRDLIDRSTGEIEWFWQAAVEDLEIEFYRPFDSVLDSSGGIAWTTWFRGGTINLAHHCLDRHAQSPGAIKSPSSLRVRMEAFAGSRMASFMLKPAGWPTHW